MADSVFSKPLPMQHSEPAAPVDWSAFNAVVESRRSVRVYTDEPLSEEDIRDCLRVAMLAPSSSNLQPWEFYWVRSPDKKAALVKACLSQPAARTARELIVCVARTKSWNRNRKLMLEAFARQGNVPKAAITYYEKLVPLAYTIGPMGLFGQLKRVGVFLNGLFKPTPREPTSEADMRVWAVKSTALACENLMLALRAKGFDSCPMEGYDSWRVRRILSLPKDAEVVMVVSAGKRAPNGVYGPRLRFPDAEFVFEV